MRDRPAYGVGLTGWAAEHRTPVWTNQAHLDPRTHVIPGTPNDPEAIIVVPLVARGTLKGALNIYRIGEDASFVEHEFELAKWFGDAAALALDNAQTRARLEHLAQTDSLTGLYNHRYFHERLRSELTRASRSHESVAVLMFDLDDFKRVNDVYGHGAGDQLLHPGRADRARHRARLRRRLPDRRRGVRGDHALVRRPRGARSRRPARQQLRRGELRADRLDDRLDRSCARATARDESTRARRLRGSGDDDREDARQEPVRPLRRGDRPRTSVVRLDLDARSSLDLAPEDAAVARRQAEPAERRAQDRRDDRRGTAAVDRLPQLSRRVARRRRAPPRRVHRRAW